MSYSRKAINFDLSTKALKKHFGENTATAYNSIKQFMLDNGFEHRQYSGYTSIELMRDRQINLLTRRLARKFTWLSSCIQEFDVTDIGEQYSLSHIFKADKIISQTKEISIKESKQETTPKDQKTTQATHKRKNHK
ncbi:VapD family protein [Helicobacter turcicus]|uniref:Vapd n=1 Tax=Helicobacter turcicus TaxID=2867412 RepID=A0ABS7JPJ0_9HELI|nr:VapD family protein [Helicobacter turcicus]MBX7491285.1 vapd [Helicobacter turcicus]MBX7546076.1 vapd [Helicobacter turcicus]